MSFTRSRLVTALDWTAGAFRAGKSARDRNEPASSNPENGYNTRRAWERGWIERDREIKQRELQQAFDKAPELHEPLIGQARVEAFCPFCRGIGSGHPDPEYKNALRFNFGCGSTALMLTPPPKKHAVRVWMSPICYSRTLARMGKSAA